MGLKRQYHRPQVRDIGPQYGHRLVQPYKPSYFDHAWIGFLAVWRSLFHKRPKGDAGTIRGGKHPPRNKPCPCGSTLKYKKCCGTTPALQRHWMLDLLKRRVAKRQMRYLDSNGEYLDYEGEAPCSTDG